MNFCKSLTYLGVVFVFIVISGFIPDSKIKHYTPRDLYTYHLQGKIIDKATDVEIEGATIKVEHKSKELANCPSESDGSYTLKFESTIKYTGAELHFIVVRDGYKDKDVTNVPIQPDIPKIVNFKLEREPVIFKRDPDARRWETIEKLEEIRRRM